jgi:hypothetical protein
LALAIDYEPPARKHTLTVGRELLESYWYW